MPESEQAARHSSGTFTLDIGGEGRHRDAWNLNPSRIVTKGDRRGQPIPKLILGRAESIPLPDHCVDCVIVERTPLRRGSLEEIKRIILPQGKIILRHAVAHGIDPHRLAVNVLPGCAQQQTYQFGDHYLQETIIAVNEYTTMP